MRVDAYSVIPQRAATNEYTANANSMFMITPAEITSVRAQMGFWSKSRSLGTRSGTAPPSMRSITSSSIPPIFT